MLKSKRYAAARTCDANRLGGRLSYTLSHNQDPEDDRKQGFCQVKHAGKLEQMVLQLKAVLEEALEGERQVIDTECLRHFCGSVEQHSKCYISFGRVLHNGTC
jgi:hypothetical protein